MHEPRIRRRVDLQCGNGSGGGGGGDSDGGGDGAISSAIKNLVTWCFSQKLNIY
jgi:hypothetical protein